MKSAYLTLGIPGNATAEEVEGAYLKAKAHYTPQHLAEADGALERFKEVQAAYDILRKPELRAAHDRKLSGVSRMTTIVKVVEPVEEPSPARRLLVVGGVIVGAVFAAGFYMSHEREQTRRALAQKEIAEKRLEKEAEDARLKAEAEAKAERARASAEANQRERQLEAESRSALSRVQADQYRQEALAKQLQRSQQIEAQRVEADQRARERQSTYEAQRRLAADKQRIRELCYQQYRRPDC
jgi:curved DNA-binding protein CbpA